MAMLASLDRRVARYVCPSWIPFGGRGLGGLLPMWRGVLGEEAVGEVLLPGPNAHIAPTTFDDWLIDGAQ